MSKCLVLFIAFVAAVMAYNKGKCGVPQQELIEHFHQERFPNLNEMDCDVARLAEEDYFDDDNCTVSAEIGRVGRYHDCFSACTIRNVLKEFDHHKEKIEECTRVPGATYGCAAIPEVLKIVWGWRGNSYKLRCIYNPATPTPRIKCMKKAETKIITQLWKKYRQL